MTTPIFSTYIRLEQLPDEVKKRHGGKVGAKVPRYDVTATAGYYRPLEALKNSKGMVIMYFNETRGIIDSPDQRRADRFLMARQGKDSINVSSVFLLNVSTTEGKPLIGYGNPNGNTKLRSGSPNSFAECKNDGFLFVITPDRQRIEMLVIPNGLNTILGNAKALADGVYDEALKTMREAATTFFQYWLP